MNRKSDTPGDFCSPKRAEKSALSRKRPTTLKISDKKP